MVWEVCVRYANGNEKVVRTYNRRETALKCIDAIYSRQGYPLHLAYVVRSRSLAGVGVLQPA